LDVPEQLPFAWQVLPIEKHRQMFGDEFGPVYITLHDAIDRQGKKVGDEVMLTASVHTPVDKWLGLSEAEVIAQKSAFTDAVLLEIERVIPTYREHVVLQYAGTPLTYEKFISKVEVGGTPLTVRNSILRPRGVDSGQKNLFIAGERVFPGPGTLSCAWSGYYAARTVAAKFLNSP
jgi:hypothetical protein